MLLKKENNILSFYINGIFNTSLSLVSDITFGVKIGENSILKLAYFHIYTI